MGRLLQGKVSVVTGASRGIGFAMVQRFLQEGATVYAVARHTESLDVLSAEIKALIPVSLDVTDQSGTKALFLEIKKEQGCLDVLVNNAAVEHNEKLGMISRNSMVDTFETNVYALIEWMQLSARLMQRKKAGSIINITSRVGQNGNPGQLVYAASKGAVIAATKSAAKELAAYQIRVNAIAPGLTDTDMFRNVPLEIMQKRISQICMGRLAQPTEIADAALFLASDLSGFVSGQVLAVDGCTVI